MIIPIGRLELVCGHVERYFPLPVTERFVENDPLRQEYYGWLWAVRVYWLRWEAGITWLS